MYSLKIQHSLALALCYPRCSGWFLKSSASLSFLISWHHFLDMSFSSLGLCSTMEHFEAQISSKFIAVFITQLLCLEPGVNGRLLHCKV